MVAMDEILYRYGLYMDAYSFSGAGEVKGLLQELIRMTYETADVMDSLGVERTDHVHRLGAIVVQLRALRERFFTLFPKPDQPQP